VSIFEWFFGQHWLGILAVLLFAIGCVLIGRGAAPFARDRRGLQLLLASPFPIAWAAALARLIPFAGSRHEVYLALFVIPAVAVALAAAAAWMTRRWHALTRPAFQVAIVVALSALIGIDAERNGVWRDEIIPQYNRNADMQKAIAYIRLHVPKRALIFTVRAYSQRLAYYLDPVSDFHGDQFGFDFRGDIEHAPPEWEFNALDRGGYRIVSCRGAWFLRTNIVTVLHHLASNYHLDSRQPVWLFGWLPPANPYAYDVYSMLKTNEQSTPFEGEAVGPYYIVQVPAGLGVQRTHLETKPTFR
jgi:hypothetical protein